MTGVAGTQDMHTDLTGRIPAEDRDQIFEPFFTTKDVGKGTGLGLSIAYSIVKRHKGEVSASCASPRGTVFRVSLPGT